MAKQTRLFLGKGLQQAISKILKTNRDEITDPRIMNALGNEAAKIMVRRTRLGYGVPDEGASREELEILSKDYIKQRKKFDGLSSFTRPGKSNLTRTNQMLTSIKSIPGKGNVIVKPTGRRTDSKLTNQQVADFVSIARPFLNISALETKALQRLYTKLIDPLFGKI